MKMPRAIPNLDQIVLEIELIIANLAPRTA